ncbi:hypothetical protein Ciccas_005734 [Cichlidogyrus casuarinus]|uniref:Rho-GAP domain-containing protein n=1 Tax=Cichlidogyrus casuarinus TaxID=1844966 RepID=A0ABD2Q7T1_9PLAT
MLQKASKLASSVNNEEAWDCMNHIIEEYPRDFLNLVQEQLSSFLNLPFDQFDQSAWPIKSRIDPPLQLKDDFDIYQTEGLFRRNGSVNRIKSSLGKFVKILQENQVKLLGQRCISVRQQLFDCFAQCTSYDLAGCLMKSMAKCVKSHQSGLESNLIPRPVIELMNKATELQYNLKTTLFSRNQDWEHCLCRARQLLTYRICTNFLLPEPESRLLSKLLKLLNLVAENEVESRMNFTALGTCLAVLVCGTDSAIKMGKEAEAMKLEIDTLSNLIRYSSELKVVPGFLFTDARNFLRCQQGNVTEEGSSRFINTGTTRQNMFASWRRQKSSVQVNSMMEKAPTFLRRMKMPRSQSSLAIKHSKSLIFD